jgi:hypothetical protein
LPAFLASAASFESLVISSLSCAAVRTIFSFFSILPPSPAGPVDSEAFVASPAFAALFASLAALVALVTSVSESAHFAALLDFNATNGSVTISTVARVSQDALVMRLVVSHAEAVLSLVLCKKMFFWGIKKREIHFLIELPVCFSFIVLNKVFIVSNNGNCWC